MGPAPGSTPRRKRRRRVTVVRLLVWCGPPLLVLGLIVIAAITTRHIGMRRLAAVEAAIAASGGITTLDGYLALAGDVDTALQEDFWTWSQGFPSTHQIPTIDSAETQAWLAGPTGTPFPDEARAALDAHPEVMRRGREFLANGSLRLSAFGWAGADLTPDASLEAIATMRIPSLHTNRELLNWLALRALVEERSDPWLADIDRLVEALVPSGAAIDAAILLSLGSTRDLAYLACAIRGHVDDARIQRWIAEVPRHREWVADGVRAERILFWGVAAGSDVTSLVATDSWATAVAGRVLDVWNAVALPHDSAAAIDALHRVEQRLRGAPGARMPDVDAISEDFLTPIGASLFMGFEGFARAALAGEVHHRAVRCAALVILESRRSGRVPDDEAAFAERWPGRLDGEGDAPPLRYERLDARQFRVSIDPDAPDSDLAAGKSIAGDSTFGLPAAEITGVFESHDVGIEVRLPEWIALDE